MPFYDLECSFCGHVVMDRLEPISATVEDRGPCPKCTALALERAWVGKPAAVSGDEVDIWIKHGLCDEVTGEPKHYTSKAEIAREARRRGLVNRVEHVGSPGSDKNRGHHTTRWVGAPVISEEERVRQWHEHEEKLQQELKTA